MWCRCLVLAAVVWSGAGEPGEGSPISRGLPRVEYLGGPWLRHPRIVTITFEADDPAVVSRLRTFGDAITRSAWWRTVVEGYCAGPGECIGEGRDGRHVPFDHAWPAAIRDMDVAAWLAGQVKAGRIGPLDADTLLVVYLPTGVALSDAFVPRYCGGGPRGLHRLLRLGRSSVPYAILPRCGSEAELTATASHEILEATTNPDPARRGFAFRRSSSNVGFMAAGTEPVDPCGILTMDQHRTEEGGFVLQRAWSNRAASNGTNPCVPASDGAYLALVPRTPTVRLSSVGERVTIVLDAAADRPVAPWSVSALDLSGRHDRRTYVDVWLDRATVAAGETASLTIVARQVPPRGLGVVGIISGVGDRSHVWPVAIMMR